MIESTLELSRVSRTSSPMFSSLSFSLLNSYMLRTYIWGLFCMICLSRLIIDILPASLRSNMEFICKWDSLGQILASLDITSSSNGSHNLSNLMKVSFSRLLSSRSKLHIISRNSLATQDLLLKVIKKRLVSYSMPKALSTLSATSPMIQGVEE